MVYDRDGLKVTAFDVDHGGLLQPAYGYRIDYQGRSVVISGDTRPSDNLATFARGADVVVHEVIAARPELLAKSADARRIVGFHTAPEDAWNIFRSHQAEAGSLFTRRIAHPDCRPIKSARALGIDVQDAHHLSGATLSRRGSMTIVINDRVDVRRFTQPGRQH